MITALNEAIKEANAQIATITAISTGKNADDSRNEMGQTLKTAVQMITGTDMENLKDAKDIGDGVAMAVEGALLPTAPDLPGVPTPDGTAMRVTPYATGGTALPTDAPIASARTFRMDNRADVTTGMTWAMIVGEADIVMERLGVNRASIPLALITGMDASDVDPADTPIVSPTAGTNSDGMYPDLFSTNSGGEINWNGIPGTVWCLEASGCSVNSAGELVGGWYFTPTSTMNLYKTNPDAVAREMTPYVLDSTAYVQWGHWLVEGASGDNSDEVRIYTYANVVGTPNTANLDLTVNTAHATEPESATYTGKAAGMSVHDETISADGAVEMISSGEFTADVSLTARFGAAPMLGGTISNFQGGGGGGGNHVDDNWSVELTEAAFANGTLATTASTTGMTGMESGQTGDWSGTAYGPAPVTVDGSSVNQRPTGVFGNFNAHFPDGHAAGAYVTQK